MTEHRKDSPGPARFKLPGPFVDPRGAPRRILMGLLGLALYLFLAWLVAPEVFSNLLRR